METKGRLHIGSPGKYRLNPPCWDRSCNLLACPIFFRRSQPAGDQHANFLPHASQNEPLPLHKQAANRQGTVLSIPSSSPYSTTHPAKIPSILPKLKHHRQVTFRPPRASESGHRTGLPATAGYRQRAARGPLSTQPPLDNRLRCLYLVRFPEAWKVVFAPVHCELNWYRCHVDQSIC